MISGVTFKWFSDMYGWVFTPDSEIALFGYSISLLDHNVSVQSTIIYGMIIAKSVILRLWKSDTVPQFKTWLTYLTGILQMERVRYGVIGNLHKFYSIWQPSLDNLDQCNAVSDQQCST